MGGGKVTITVAPIMIMVVVVAAALQSAEATTYKVGDDSGWTDGDSSLYSNWASAHTFLVNDVLEFIWTGSHTVAQVSKSEYDSCTSTSDTTLATSPAKATLDSASSFYFICTVGSHCARGQKLTVVVSDSSSTTPGTPTSPPTSPLTSPPTSSPTTNTTTSSPPPPPPPPPSSSASSLAAGAATSVIFGLIYVVGLL